MYSVRVLYKALLQHTNISDEKPDDGQCWPKYVVFILFYETSIRYNCCVVDLITLPINYYTQREWHISKFLKLQNFQKNCTRGSWPISSPIQ